MYTKIIDLAQRTAEQSHRHVESWQVRHCTVGAGQRRGEGDPSLKGPGLGDPADLARVFPAQCCGPAEIV